MKTKLSLITLLTCSIFTAFSQITLPRASPSAEINQTVGITEFNVKYSRPSVKGRVIFGDLVPLDQVWRTGANENTTFTSNTSFTIDGKNLKAGTYSIYTVPKEGSCDIILYTDTQNWGTPRKWDNSKEAVRINVALKEVSKNELLTFSFSNIKSDTASMNIIWDTYKISMDITVPTDEIVLASIDNVMKGSPSKSEFVTAAKYYFSIDKNIDKSLEWMTKGMDDSKDQYWLMHDNALMLSKAGEIKKAKKMAKKSLKLAKKAENKTYIQKNESVLDEWNK